MIPVFEPKIKIKHALRVFFQIMSGWIGSGEMVLEFENKIKEISSSKNVITTTSATTALMIAVASLELPEKSTILFPSYTFLAGANACKFLGYNVKLVDVNENSLCMDPDLVDISGEISALIFVNHNSYVGDDVRKIKKICNLKKIPMIEDSSQGIGVNGAGLTGDIGVFSFSVPKLITTGQGGAILTNRNDIAQKCRQIRDHGGDWRKSKTHKNLGVNFKFNDILASYGLSQLIDIRKLIKKRNRIFDWYRKYINIIDYNYRSSWAVIYKTQKADEIINRLAKNNFQAVKYYIPISWNPPYKTAQPYPVADKLYQQLVYLPSSLTLKQKYVKKICNHILEVEHG